MLADSLSLADTWEARANDLERYGAPPGLVRAWRLAAEELRAGARAADGEALTLAEAVAESGYSERRLREMLADGSLPQAGRKGVPRIRRGDLPKKPRPIAPGGYDPAADAARVLERRRNRGEAA